MQRSLFKIKDRRHVKPRSFVFVGFMLGLFAANPISLLAQAQVDLAAWVQPPVVMSILGVFISMAVTRQMVMDDRLRLTRLEANTVHRETLNETMKRVDESLQHLRLRQDRQDEEHRR